MSKNKKIVTGAVAAIVVLALAGGIWWYIDERPKTPDITDQEAQQIALEDAGLTAENAMITVSYDNEDNEYDVDVISADGSQEYEYTINGKNGKIKDKEMTTRSIPSTQSGNAGISQNGNANSGNSAANANGAASAATLTLEDAKNAALKDGGFSASDVNFVKQEFDADSNEYDVEYIATDKNDGKQYKYEYEINASNGNINNKSKDVDIY